MLVKISNRFFLRKAISSLNSLHASLYFSADIRKDYYTKICVPTTTTREFGNYLSSGLFTERIIHAGTTPNNENGTLCPGEDHDYISLLRLARLPSQTVGLGTASPFSSADENMLRRSSPLTHAKQLAYSGHKQKTPKGVLLFVPGRGLEPPCPLRAPPPQGGTSIQFRHPGHYFTNFFVPDGKDFPTIRNIFSIFNRLRERHNTSLA